VVVFTILFLNKVFFLKKLIFFNNLNILIYSRKRGAQPMDETNLSKSIWTAKRSKDDDNGTDPDFIKLIS